MATHLTVGYRAPLFTGVDHEGRTICLDHFKGKKVVLYFYPQDDTPTCTVQACNLRDHYHLLQDKGYVVIGISPDEVQSHQKFKAKYKLPFTLLSDPQHTIINQYGVWGEKNLYGRKYMGLHRTTFIIDENGVIEKVIRKPRSKNHAAEIMQR